MRLLPFTALVALASVMITQGLTIPKGSTVPNAPLQRKLLTAQEITSLYAQNGLTVPTGVSSKFISSAPIHNAPVTTVAAPPRKLATKGIDINDCSINYYPCDLYIQDTLTAHGIDVDSENYDQAITDFSTQWTTGVVDTRTMNQYITMSNSILGIKTPQIGAPVAASAPQRKLASGIDIGAGRVLSDDNGYYANNCDDECSACSLYLDYMVAKYSSKMDVSQRVFICFTSNIDQKKRILGVISIKITVLEFVV